MTTIQNAPGFNYKDLNIKGNKQLGGTEAATSEINYNDGLSKKEMQTIDTNKDGVITYEEFRTALSNADGTQDLWNSITSYTVSAFNSSDNTVTQTLSGGKTITTKFDTNNKPTETTLTKSTGKSTTTFNTDGTTKTVVTDAQDNKISETIKQENGDYSKTTFTTTDGVETQTTKNYGVNKKLTSTTVKSGTQTTKTYASTGMEKVTDTSLNTVTNKSKDGTNVTLDANNNLKNISTKIDGTDISAQMTYDSDNKLTSVKIGDNTYDNVSVKNGKITVKDANGNTVFSMAPTSNGKTNVSFYEGNKKTGMVTLNSDNHPESVREYDTATGKAKTRRFCNTQRLRTYTYDETSGKLLSSIDTLNGVKLSKQTYKDGTSAWADRILYDATGNETKYYTYDSGAKDANGNRTVTTRKYTSSAKSEMSSVVTTNYDKYNNKLSSSTGDTTTTYNYDDTAPTKKLTKNHLKSTTTVKTETLGSTTTYTTRYTDGIAVQRVKVEPETSEGNGENEHAGETDVLNP